jgi:hypothetical protein
VRAHGWARRFAAVALLLFATVLVVDAFIHTDDGCQVETHCVACRLAYSHGIPAPVSPPLVAPFDSSQPLSVAVSSPALQLATKPRRPRGPPSTC